jgi:ABC-type Fe3+/spermidine/putrescine transport system ATPase subunit
MAHVINRSQSAQVPRSDSASAATTGVGVRVEDLSHNYDGTDFAALRGVSLEIRAGEFMTLLGPSGSGKTTLLLAVAGLIMPAAGTIYLGDRDISAAPPERRDLGFVFQNYALFPHLTVGQNIAFPLEMRKVDPRTAETLVAEALELVGLSGAANRYPSQLSGGQQQRVALARAIVFKPKVLLLDEPLGALDRRLRQQLGLELRRLQRELAITTIYVTHDQEEAFVLSNRITVVHEGQLLQTGTPAELYSRPTSLFTAKFLGDLNVIEGALEGNLNGMSLVRTEGDATVSASTLVGTAVPGTRVVWAIRPEDLELSRAGSSPLYGRVQAAIFGGSSTRYEVSLQQGGRLEVLSRARSVTFEEGSEVSVGYEPGKAMIFAS